MKWVVIMEDSNEPSTILATRTELVLDDWGSMSPQLSKIIFYTLVNRRRSDSSVSPQLKPASLLSAD